MTGKSLIIKIRYCFINALLGHSQIVIKFVHCLADSNLAGMNKFYYYLRMTKQCIDKTISDLDYQIFFPVILSPANIWNDSDDEIDEEE